MKTNRTYSLFSTKVIGTLLLSIAFFFNACELESLETCNTNLTSTNVSMTTFDAGEILTADVNFRETIGIDDLQIPSIVQWYLSEDNSLGGDTQLLAFLDASETSRSGDNVSLTFNEIEIPLTQASGDYFLIVRLLGQPCGGGEVSDDDTEVIAVTIN